MKKNAIETVDLILDLPLSWIVAFFMPCFIRIVVNEMSFLEAILRIIFQSVGFIIISFITFIVVFSFKTIRDATKNRKQKKENEIKE